MTDNARPGWIAAAVLSLAALTSACASTTINKVLADPSHYKNREVRLSGSVVDSYSFSNRGVYRIGDETGDLWVVSDRGVPRKGARVSVTGRIQEGFNVGSIMDRVTLPAGIGSGLVMIESSHKAER
jgi:hypothetical protein